jgi:hypothetical protein
MLREYLNGNPDGLNLETMLAPDGASIHDDVAKLKSIIKPEK